MIQTIIDQLTGTHMARTLISAMEREFEDFAGNRQRYIKAMEFLRGELGDAATQEQTAIEQQAASALLFSAMLGLKANLDNFIDPVARNFLDTTPEIYLREATARKLPVYERAEKARSLFYATLTPTQQTIYEDVLTYTTHLETVLPKLAHYYGYMLGNQLLPLVVPGYHPDTVLTFRYRAMLHDYFGKSFLQDI